MYLGGDGHVFVVSEEGVKHGCPLPNLPQNCHLVAIPDSAGNKKRVSAESKSVFCQM